MQFRCFYCEIVYYSHWNTCARLYFWAPRCEASSASYLNMAVFYWGVLAHEARPSFESIIPIQIPFPNLFCSRFPLFYFFRWSLTFFFYFADLNFFSRSLLRQCFLCRHLAFLFGPRGCYVLRHLESRWRRYKLFILLFFKMRSALYASVSL